MGMYLGTRVTLCLVWRVGMWVCVCASEPVRASGCTSTCASPVSTCPRHDPPYPRARVPACRYYVAYGVLVGPMALGACLATCPDAAATSVTCLGMDMLTSHAHIVAHPSVAWHEWGDTPAGALAVALAAQTAAVSAVLAVGWLVSFACVWWSSAAVEARSWGAPPSPEALTGGGVGDGGAGGQAAPMQAHMHPHAAVLALHLHPCGVCVVGDEATPSHLRRGRGWAQVGFVARAVWYYGEVLAYV